MIRKGKTTIRDVAAAAKLSVTTVSDALSGKGRLPEATRTKVRAIAKRLNYRPSAIARGLRDNGLGLVGICIAPAGGGGVLTDVSYWVAIVNHASQSILAEGLAPILLPHSVEVLSKLRIPLDGAIVIDPLEHDPVLASFDKKKIHCVTIGRDLSRDDNLWVDDDNSAGVRQLLSETMPSGSRLAFLTIGPKKSYVADALEGAQLWAAENGAAVKVYSCANLDVAGVSEAVRRALDGGATAMIAQNDRLALRILMALNEQGQQVPGNVRLVSASDAPELEHVIPGISAASQHPARLATMAAAALLGLIRGRSVVAPTKLPMEITIRPSAPKI